MRLWRQNPNKPPVARAYRKARLIGNAFILLPFAYMMWSMWRVHSPPNPGDPFWKMVGPILLDGLAPSVVLLGGVLAIRAWILHTRRRVAAAGYKVCPECDYSLEGQTDRCPECGTPFTQESLEKAWAGALIRRSVPSAAGCPSPKGFATPAPPLQG